VSDIHTVVGLDLSLTGAGYAAIQNRDATECGSPRFITKTFASAGATKDSIAKRAERIEKMADEIVDEISNLIDFPRLICLEDMPYGARGAGTVDRTGLWWLVVTKIRRRFYIPIILVNVSTVKIYATGRGNKVDKDEVVLAIARRYRDAPITNNNEADAFTLAAIGKRLLGEPIEESLPQTHLRAMDKLSLTS
jgi:crossover junction endodeoxyribonuclease RuvC